MILALLESHGEPSIPYLPISRPGAMHFVQADHAPLSARHDRADVNKGVEEWGEFFGNGVMAH